MDIQKIEKLLNGIIAHPDCTILIARKLAELANIINAESNLVEARVSLQTADLNKLLPYFIGLWAYQVYWEQRTEKEKTFCITLLINGKHVDTKDHINIKDAVIEAEKIIDDSRLSS